MFVGGLCYAQTGLSTAENYVYNKTCLDADCVKKIETVQYFDGLGRLKQAIDIKATPTGKDVVKYIKYDPYGRQTENYLPIPQTVSQNGAAYSLPLANAPSVYGTEKIYSEKVLENSPAGLLKKMIPAGTIWSAHPVDLSYSANAVDEVKKITVLTSWVDGITSTKASYNGMYAAGLLLKSSATDADQNITTEYKNGLGQTILTRKKNGAQNADTYYVYNEYGQLAYVIPPLASALSDLSTTVLDNLCYQYRYDGQNRLAEKKLPGKGWEYIVYDKQDRVVMSQDTNMKGKGQWLFTKYDKLGRVLYTGIMAGGERKTEQATLDTKGANNEVKTSAVSFTQNGMSVYYTNASAYPTAIQQLLSINYYDTYPTGTPTIPTTILGQSVLLQDPGTASASTKGLSTASYIKNMDEDNWTKSYVWYNAKAQTIGAHSINYLGGYTKTETKLDFAGVTTQTKAYHKRLSTDTEKVITQNFEYDNQNRLLVQKHKVDNNPEEILSQNQYNELSQLTSKKIGASATSSALQNIEYTYDIRGALLKINNPTSLNDKLFGYEIKYSNPLKTTAKYNGNITEVDWKTSNDGVLRRYSYEYDALNRLKKASYSEPGTSTPENGFYNETLDYDLGGNIISLQRNAKNQAGVAEQIDDLIYNYTGNRLNTITDSKQNYMGYPDTSGGKISYDDNGNMRNHIDKGILRIDYNILNLPENVVFDKTYKPRIFIEGATFNVNTRYLYRADGTKLKKTYTYGVGKTNLETKTITEYLDGFQYEAIDTGSLSNQILKFVPTSEGYYNFENNKYIYNYTDHLGNVRLSYTKGTSGSAEVLEENNYYPFGLKHEGYNTSNGNPAYKYQYNNKELQQETGWNDYGARMYMSDIGRWGVIDHLAETSRRWTTYNYAFDNPINFIDPDGKRAVAPSSPSQNFFVPGGMLDYYVSGGNGSRSGITSWTGQNESIVNEDMMTGGVGTIKTFGQTQAYRDIMAYMNGDPNSIYSKFLKDIASYRNNKPGFGDDGGYLNISNGELKYIYFDKVVNEFYTKNTLIFNDTQGLSNYINEMQNANKNVNNSLNVALGFASLPGKVLPIIASVTLGMLGPEYVTEPWSVEPRLGDRLVGNTTYKLMFSVNGDVRLNVSNYVFQYNSNNEYLGRKSFSKEYDLSYQMKDVILYLLGAKTKINKPIYVK